MKEYISHGQPFSVRRATTSGLINVYAGLTRSEVLSLACPACLGEESAVCHKQVIRSVESVTSV